MQNKIKKVQNFLKNKNFKHYQGFKTILVVNKQITNLNSGNFPNF